jgi:hypothetical protein
MDKFMYKNKLYCVFLCSVCFFDLFGCITLIMYHDAWSAIPSSALKFLQILANGCSMLQPRAGKKWSNNLSDLLCDLRGPYESGAVEAASFESLSDQARNKTESSFCFFQVTEYVTFVKLEPS